MEDAPVFQDRARLFRLDDRKWEPVGVGTVTLTRNPASAAVTFTLEDGDSGEVVARHVILQNMYLEPHAESDRSMIYKAMDDVASSSYWATYAIRFPSADVATSFSMLYKQASERSPFRHPVSPQSLLVPANGAKPSSDTSSLASSGVATLGASATSWGTSTTASDGATSTGAEAPSAIKASPGASPAPTNGSASWVYVPEQEPVSQSAAEAVAVAATAEPAGEVATPAAELDEEDAESADTPVLTPGEASQLEAQWHQWVWGAGHVNMGGANVVKELAALLGVSPGNSVLNIGCGPGGPSVVVASTLDVSVVGTDTSPALIEQAGSTLAAAQGRSETTLNVVFQVASLCTPQSPRFHAVLGCEVLMRVEDKQAVLGLLHGALQPGGTLVLSDFCSGVVSTRDLEAYTAAKALHLVQTKEYGSMVTAAGFEDVLVQDRTDRLVSLLEKDLTRLRRGKADFARTFSVSQFEELESEWMHMLKRAQANVQKWVLVTARKPVPAPAPSAAPAAAEPAPSAGAGSSTPAPQPAPRPPQRLLTAPAATLDNGGKTAAKPPPVVDVAATTPEASFPTKRVLGAIAVAAFAVGAAYFFRLRRRGSK